MATSALPEYIANDPVLRAYLEEIGEDSVDMAAYEIHDGDVHIEGDYAPFSEASRRGVCIVGNLYVDGVLSVSPLLQGALLIVTGTIRAKHMIYASMRSHLYMGHGAVIDGVCYLGEHYRIASSKVECKQLIYYTMFSFEDAPKHVEAEAYYNFSTEAYKVFRDDFYGYDAARGRVVFYFDRLIDTLRQGGVPLFEEERVEAISRQYAAKKKEKERLNDPTYRAAKNFFYTLIDTEYQGVRLGGFEPVPLDEIKRLRLRVCDDERLFKDTYLESGYYKLRCANTPAATTKTDKKKRSDAGVSAMELFCAYNDLFVFAFEKNAMYYSHLFDVWRTHPLACYAQHKRYLKQDRYLALYWLCIFGFAEDEARMAEVKNFGKVHLEWEMYAGAVAYFDYGMQRDIAAYDAKRTWLRKQLAVATA